MAPPQITQPPTRPRELRPRQSYDPGMYDSMLSSLYAELSSLYPELYSSYDPGYYSSIQSDYYASLLGAYSSALATQTRTAAAGRTGVTSGGARATGTTEPASNGNGGGGGGGGLSTGAKIGIGVAVPLIVCLLAGLGIFLWCAGKRKGKKSSTTVVAPANGIGMQQQPMQQGPVPQQQYQPPQQQNMGYVQNPGQQGYVQGYQQQHHQQFAPMPAAPTPTPPPGYVPPHQGANQYGGAYGGYKGPEPGVAELEHEYHFARPGVVELGDGREEPVQPVQQDEGKVGKKSKMGWLKK
ncbi:hypothetical protein BCR34DRAFT_601936 [Clohesyomyces aquaticus]|uniref:Uncharacterized protein n=1 Tax=Clohesyomyces aquaticus TaxID=1231657 RepID=A0A1Y1ZKU0_9PLEO|nr:hypothetical protein BCR34DRAFT_601936 [Clohesyomyces aquaticus]